jgi:cytochrome c553
MKRHVIIAICLVITIGFIAATPEDPKPPKQNLKVLPKNIDHEGLEKVMGEWRRALGVNCGFCHARVKDTTQRKLDFASDEKEEKEMARKMFKMTAKINKKFFKHVGEEEKEHNSIALVTCATCHNGSPHPINKMPITPRPERQGPPLGGQGSERGEKH